MICTKCGRDLPESEFYVRRGKTSRRCKQCDKGASRDQYKRKKQAEGIEDRNIIQREKRCGTCIYRTMVNGHEPACFYIGVTGKRRPCPGDDPEGTRCAIYKKGKAIGEKSTWFGVGL